MGSAGSEVASVSKRREIVKRLFGRDKTEIQEIPSVPEIPPEIELAQPVPGASTQLTQPVTDDQTGQTLVSSADPQTPQIVLPLTDDQVEIGLKLKVVNSIRWLAVWCIRILKRVAVGDEK